MLQVQFLAVFDQKKGRGAKPTPAEPVRLSLMDGSCRVRLVIREMVGERYMYLSCGTRQFCCVARVVSF